MKKRYFYPQHENPCRIDNEAIKRFASEFQIQMKTLPASQNFQSISEIILNPKSNALKAEVIGKFLWEKIRIYVTSISRWKKADETSWNFPEFLRNH